MSKGGKSRKSKSSDAPPKKRGNPGDFLGARAVFLNSKLPEYTRYSQEGKTRRFWPGLFKEYWELFPWRLPLNVEPDDDLVLDNSAAPDEEDRKAEVTQELQKVCAPRRVLRIVR